MYNHDIIYIYTLYLDTYKPLHSLTLQCSIAKNNYYHQGECWWCSKDLKGFRGWWLKRYFWVWRNIWCNCLEDIIEIYTLRQLCKKPPGTHSRFWSLVHWLKKNLTVLSKTRTVDYYLHHEQSILNITICCHSFKLEPWMFVDEVPRLFKV